MKKIFTLLFFVGFLTSAFAQEDHRHQNGNQPNDSRYQSPKYQGGNDYSYSKSHPGNNGYNENGQWDRRSHENDYGYNKDRDHRDRDDMRRDQYSHSQYGNQEREDHPYGATHRVPLIRIIFGVGGIL